MTTARILLTTAGRKSYLAHILRAASHPAWIAAVDLDAHATIRPFVDRFDVVPPVSEEDAFVSAILGLCAEQEIRCVLPQNDRELIALANARGRFEKQDILIAGVDVTNARIARDKLLLSDWLRENGYRSVETWTSIPKEASISPDDAFVEKSRAGQGSEGLRFHSTLPTELASRDSILQRRLVGDEYNLDILRDLAGNVVCVSAKKKLSMENGSTARAVSVRSEALEELGQRLAEDLGVFGSIDVDVISTEHGPVVIDINPRIGGGFPFTATYYPAYVEHLLAVCTGATVGPRPLHYDAGQIVAREYSFSLQAEAARGLGSNSQQGDPLWTN